MSSAILSFVISCTIGIIIGPILIPILKKLKCGQSIREDGPESHMKKAGTPTMGGLIFIFAFFLASLIMGKYSSIFWVMLGAVLGNGLIGFLDDYLIVVKKRSLGLTAIQKLIGQFALAFLLILVVCKILGAGTDIVIPIIGKTFDLGVFYYIIISIYLVGMINAVNLTDGLDGLASGISLFVFVAYSIIALLAIKNPPIANFNYADLAITSAALAGGCLAFLFYNKHPAKVFMGDTGSLALGGGLVAAAILTKTEIILIVLGGVYLINAVSVILQVLSFKMFGKRIFLMSPLHHHFELKGWAETKVVKVFWLVALIFAIIGVLLFKATYN